MDNPNSGRYGTKDEVCTGRDGALSSGPYVGDTDCLGSRETSRPEQQAERASVSGKRVVGDTDCTGSQERARESSSAVQGINPASGAKDKRQTESQLGGTVDGATSGLDPTANRVDRLRLLGNGVVPDTAEVAFRTLYKELMDENQSNQS